MAKNVHMIVPWEERVHLTPFHTVSRIQVVLDKDDAHWMSGKKDDPEQKLMLSKVQIESIAEAAGVQILESKPLTDTPERVVWQVRLAVEGLDGKRSEVIRTYELDMRLKDRDGVDGGFILNARNNARKKMEKAISNAVFHNKWTMPKRDAPNKEWEEWIENTAMDDWYMTNRHRVRRAETGATLAAMRTKFRIKNIYEAQEFEQPWVVYRANFDMQKAIQAGGAIGEMALKGVVASMTRQLGVSSEMAESMIKSLPAQTNGPMNTDLMVANEEEVDKLEQEMIDVGFSNRANCDDRSMDIFGVPLSQLDNRQVRLMREYIELGKSALEHINKEDIKEFTQAVIEAIQIAYASNTTIEEEVEQEWYDAAMGIVEAADEGEPEESTEVETSEEQEPGEPDESDVEVAEEEEVPDGDGEEEPDEETEGGNEKEPPTMMDIIGSKE